MREERVLMQKDGEIKRVKPGSVEDFRSVGWEKVGKDIGEAPNITDEVGKMPKKPDRARATDRFGRKELSYRGTRKSKTAGT